MEMLFFFLFVVQIRYDVGAFSKCFLTLLRLAAVLLLFFLNCADAICQFVNAKY